MIELGVERKKHDDRQGHHYYTRWSRSMKVMYSSDDSCGHYAWRKKDHADFPTSRILTKDELFHRMCNIAHICIYVYLQKERGCHHGTCDLRQHYYANSYPSFTIPQYH